MSSNSTDCNLTIPCVPLRDSFLAHRPTCPPRCSLAIGLDHDQLRQLPKSFSARSIQTLPIKVPADHDTRSRGAVGRTPLRLLGCTSKSTPEQAQDEGQAKVPSASLNQGHQESRGLCGADTVGGEADLETREAMRWI
ncbi:hypothetical protein C8J56DRAFT_1170169 [Mycena floridula]|nr:hypothetical protein C8J56DRAFT_1170169 [Mycena floridula]